MARRSKKARRDIDTCSHTDKERVNNPPVGLVTPETDRDARGKSYAHDPHLDPQLSWSGKAEHTSFEVPTVSLHVHERIDPRTTIEAVRRRNGTERQMSLFASPGENPPIRQAIEFYRHRHNWTNRLIAGDSLPVMNSLIEKEGLGRQVQMVYMDPPNGIRYGSNFQPFVNRRDVRDDRDEELTQEPETIRAFHDTWKLGIHPYLYYLRDRLLLARELLHESGSCFVQIGDENMHHVRESMDEVFGARNFVTQIYFSTTGGFASSTLSRVGDCLVWYARDRASIKDCPLFRGKPGLKTGDEASKYVELPDGSRMPMSKEERSGQKPLAKGARIFTYGDLQSSGSAIADTPSEFHGEIFRPIRNNHWNANWPDGMERLKAARRIGRVGNTLRCVQFIEENPVNPLTNPWMDTSFAGFATDKKYVVGTNPKVIQRCLLMTTDPGDLVFDPTCGSGTAAYVEEQWGCRWTTCNTSRVAITVPAPSVRPLDDIDDGEAVPADASMARTGPTVRQGDCRHELLKTGIRGKAGQRVSFVRLELLPGAKRLHSEGETRPDEASGEGSPDTAPGSRVVVSFGPGHAQMEQRQVALAIEESHRLVPKPAVIVFAAFQFDPEASKDIDETNWPGVTLLKPQMNADLLTDDLKKKHASNESFWLVGQPDVALERIPDGEGEGRFRVSVRGFDYYNTKTGNVESGGDRIALWMLDPDYDGRSLIPRQVFFPMAGAKDGRAKLARSLKAEIDKTRMAADRGTVSLPFEPGEHGRAAVKIVDDRSVESLKIVVLG